MATISSGYAAKIKTTTKFAPQSEAKAKTDVKVLPKKTIVQDSRSFYSHNRTGSPSLSEVPKVSQRDVSRAGTTTVMTKVTSGATKPTNNARNRAVSMDARKSAQAKASSGSLQAPLSTIVGATDWEAGDQTKTFDAIDFRGWVSSSGSAATQTPAVHSSQVQQFVAGMPSSVLENLNSKYDITTSYKLGYGRHSDVIQARSKKGGQDYAIKVLALGEISEKKVRREVSAMAEFSHQYCAKMVDCVLCREALPNVKRKPPYVCIVMKHITDAETLSNMIRKHGPNQTLAWRVLWHLASALSEMHKHGLVHRDVWSENVLVDSSLNSYLIDFGCTESNFKQSGLQTDAGLNIPYLSPQVSKKEPPSSSEDMWALGLVLTEVVTGRHIIFRMGRHDIPFYTQPDCLATALEETAAQGGPVLGQICKRLLDLNASKRATAAEALSMFGTSSIPSTVSSSTVQATSGGMSSPTRYQTTQAQTQRSAIGTTASNYSSAIPNVDVTGGSDLSAGRQVIYQASSHDASYLATVLGRAPGQNAWIIQLLGGGTKDVPDSESWRLSTSKVGQAQTASAPSNGATKSSLDASPRKGQDTASISFGSGELISTKTWMSPAPDAAGTSTLCWSSAPEIAPSTKTYISAAADTATSTKTYIAATSDASNATKTYISAASEIANGTKTYISAASKPATSTIPWGSTTIKTTF